MASQDITVDVAEVSERLSCTYRRTSKVILTTSGPCGGSWTWIAERGAAGVEVGGVEL